MADENKLRSLKDLHSAIANLAAHYIPKHEMADYFKPEEIESAQNRPSYSVTDEQRGVIESIVLNLVEKKTKTVQKKGKEKEVTASAAESLVMAAKDSLPALLRNDEDNYQNLVHLHPAKMRRFVAGVKDNILAYLQHNQKRLQQYGVDEAIAAVNKLDRGLENRVIGACKKEIRNLSAGLRAETRDVCGAYRKVGTLERKNERLERKADKLKVKKEELESAVAALETENAREVDANVELGKANVALKETASRLESEKAKLSKDLDKVKKEYDADLKRLADANTNLIRVENEKAGLTIDLAQAIEYADAEIKELQKQAASAKLVLEKEKTAHAEVNGMYKQEKAEREKFETAYTALNARYKARFAELGSMVAEWYAFAEKMLLHSKELSENEQLKELRSRSKSLSALVAGMIEEVKSGKRFDKGKKDVHAPWRNTEEAPLPTLEDTESGYKQALAKAKAAHQRELWGWMHALDKAETPYELKQEVYKRFLSADPQDHVIRGIAQCNLGTILAEKRKDYIAAKMQYALAVESAKAELAEKPGDKDAEIRLKRYSANLALCQEQLAA